MLHKCNLERLYRMDEVVISNIKNIKNNNNNKFFIYNSIYKKLFLSIFNIFN